MLKLKEELFAVEKDRLSGKKGCTLDEFDVYLDDVITDKDAVKFSLSGGEWSENLGGNTKIPVGDWKID